MQDVTVISWHSLSEDRTSLCGVGDVIVDIGSGNRHGPGTGPPLGMK
jgi:hypothetical protein